MGNKKIQEISAEELSKLSQEGLQTLKDKFGIELKLKSDNSVINDILLDWEKFHQSTNAEYDRAFDRTNPGYDRAYDRDRSNLEKS
jgi:hypothetical protein